MEGGFSVAQAGAPTRFVINNTGALILELANGRYSVVEIVGVVQDAFGLADPPYAQVMAFVDSASQCRLVDAEWHKERN